ALELARAGAAARGPRNEAPEEVVQRIVLLEVRALRGTATLARLGSADVDDGGTLSLGEVGEIGKLARLRVQGGRKPKQQPDQQYSRHREILARTAGGSAGPTTSLVVLHRVGDVFYALRRRLADHRDPIVADRSGVDVDRSLPRQAR